MTMTLTDRVSSKYFWYPSFLDEFFVFLPVLQVPMVAKQQGPYGLLVAQVWLARVLALDGHSRAVARLDPEVMQRPLVLVVKAARAA
jgi:hypothetical protein